MSAARFEKVSSVDIVDFKELRRFLIVPRVVDGDAVAEEGFSLVSPTFPRKNLSLPGSSAHCQGAAMISPGLRSEARNSSRLTLVVGATTKRETLDVGREKKKLVFL